MRRKDDLVQIAQVMFWYHTIRVALGKSSAYAVEKAVEPEAFSMRTGAGSCNNKWRGYKRGEHLPQRHSQVLAERVVPGSSALLQHPIWKIGRLPNVVCISDLASGLLGELAPDLQPVFFRFDSTSNQIVRRGVSSRKLNMLRQRADLDALAALSVFLREAAEGRRYKLSMQVADTLYRTLFHCAISKNEALQTALPYIFKMLVHRVFTFAADRRRRWCFDGVDCLQLFRTIQYVCRANEVHERPTSRINLLIDYACLCKPIGIASFRPPLRPLNSDARNGSDDESWYERIEWWKHLIAKTHGADS